MLTTKMQGTLESRVQKILTEAVELADLGDRHTSAAKIAVRVFESEPEIMAEFSRQCAIERLTWMISRGRRLLWDSKSPGQMVINDPIFQGLPKTIFLRNGKRPNLNACTVSEIDDHLKLLRERFRNHPRVTQFEAVAELHHKWASVKKNITWIQAQQREAEERESQ